MDIALDDSQEYIEWEDICNAKHLDPNLTYQKIVSEIDKYLVPKYNLFLSLDYESMKLLLKQGKEYGSHFSSTPELVALLISKCDDAETIKKLYLDYGYGNGIKTSLILDLHLYKKICQSIGDNVDISEIEKYHKKHVKQTLDDISSFLFIDLMRDNYITNQYYYFDEYANLRDVDEPPKLFYLDLIADYFFDDYYNNVYIDMNQILKYVGLSNNNDIPLDRMKFYRDFVNLKELSYEEQRDFYLNNKNVNMVEEFYDDIRNLKSKSYQSLVDSCTKFTKDSPLYNQELSNKHHCEVYYLNGQEFNAFVRSNVDVDKYDLEIHKEGEKTVAKPIELPIPNKDEVSRLSNSFTFIGKEDIQTYKHPNSKLTMLYRGINPEYIGHIYHNDSWSSDYYNYSDYANEIHTPESLLKESARYPEIFITNLEGVEPYALLCLDTITPWDEKFSNTYNMPIVLINSTKYERKYRENDYHVDQYVR